jgi:hypothetical protein
MAFFKYFILITSEAVEPRNSFSPCLALQSSGFPIRCGIIPATSMSQGVGFGIRGVCDPLRLCQRPVLVGIVNLYSQAEQG